MDMDWTRKNHTPTTMFPNLNSLYISLRGYYKEIAYGEKSLNERDLRCKVQVFYFTNEAQS